MKNQLNAHRCGNTRITAPRPANGKVLRWRELARGGSVEVGRARVVHHDRRGRLLGNDLKGLGQRHADAFGGIEQAKNDRRAERGPDTHRSPRNIASRGLRRVRAPCECAGACIRQALRRIAPRNRAENTSRCNRRYLATLRSAASACVPTVTTCNAMTSLALPSFGFAQIVGQTQMFAAGLARECEPRDLPRRICRVVDDDVVTQAGRGEIAVHNARFQQPVSQRNGLIAMQSRLESSRNSRSNASPLVLAAPHESRKRLRRSKHGHNVAHVDVRRAFAGPQKRRRGAPRRGRS